MRYQSAPRRVLSSRPACHAGRDGFDVIDVIAQVDPNRSAAGDVTFVCEKRADGAPVTFTVKASGGVTRVEGEVNDLAAAGHTLRPLWAGTYVLSALLSLASTTTSATKHSYEIDAVPDVSSMSGRLVAWVRFKSEQVAAFGALCAGRQGRAQFERHPGAVAVTTEARLRTSTSSQSSPRHAS